MVCLGKEVIAINHVIFSAVIAGKHCKINAGIVKKTLLLLSKQSTKKCQKRIDMINHKAVIFRNKINLHFSTSGHYCVDMF